MIKDQLKVHAGHSFELKMDFPSKDFLGKGSQVGLDMFLFLPPALDVDRHNFSRMDFYKSLKSYIRLSTAKYKMNDIVSSDSPVHLTLVRSIRQMKVGAGTKSVNQIIGSLKLYVSSVDKSIRDEVKRLLRIKDTQQKTYAVGLFLQQCSLVRKQFEGAFCGNKQQNWDPRIVRAIRFADEYQSLMFEGHLQVLHNGLGSSFSEESPEIKRLHGLVFHEIHYREQAAYPSIARVSHSNEGVLHRRGRLKRYIESYLFLNTATKKEGVLYEQLLFSLAAGLAMIFATSMAFASQYAFGNLTLPFFVVLVVSYMFKDRIKELSRIYFDKKRKKMFFDFRTMIAVQKKMQIGYMRESFQFLKQQYVPAKVKEAREKMRVTEISEEWIGDRVIHYKTKINLSPRRIRKLDYFEGITQIFRFNISPFTMKMDDHEKEIFIKTKKHLRRQLVHRVYHLNLIFRYTTDKEIKYKYYKLIADKSGIKRIDRIAMV